MNMKFLKAYRDLTINPRRTFLAIFALVLGIWGVGTVLVSYTILTKDLNTNFQQTLPAHLILEATNFTNLDLTTFENQLEIESLAFRDFSVQRIEIQPDVWVPLLLYAVEDFGAMNMAKIFKEEGAFSPPKGTILLERDGMKISNIVIGASPRIRVGNKMQTIQVSGICFDPAQAPATQDHLVYAYCDKNTFTELTGAPINQRLIIRLNGVNSKQEVSQVAMSLKRTLEGQGINITNTSIPAFNEHPHQWQLNTLLFLIGSIGLLAFLMSGVLIAQLMKSIMANQVRQIGILKAIGATQFQIFQIYSTFLLLLGLISGIIGVPIAVATGTTFAYFVANILNFNVLSTVPFSVYLFLFSVSVLLPVFVSFFTLVKGTRTSVKLALNDYGISHPSQTQSFSFLTPFSLTNSTVLSIRNSLRNRGRLSITILTMALGVAIFSTGFNVRQSLWELLSSLDKELQYDVQIVLNEQITKEQAIAPFKGIANVVSIDTWQKGRGQLIANLASTDKAIAIEALPYNTTLLKPKIIKGQWLSKSKTLEVVLNQQAWGLTDFITIGKDFDLMIQDTIISVKLVGIVEQFAVAKVYVDLEKFDALFNPTNLINTLTFVAKNQEYEKIDTLKKAIEKAITPSPLEVRSVVSHAESVRVVYAHLNIILSSIVLLSFLILLVSAIGMASAMSINIVERTREIGIMRAIGATPKMIFTLFVKEGLFISCFSILIGLIFSYPLSKMAAIFFGNLILGEETILQYAFSPLGFFITIFVTIFFGWLASRIPAKNAIHVTTSTALSYE